VICLLWINFSGSDMLAVQCFSYQFTVWAVPKLLVVWWEESHILIKNSIMVSCIACEMVKPELSLIHDIISHNQPIYHYIHIINIKLPLKSRGS
jgi:hypothetical protein